MTQKELKLEPEQHEPSNGDTGANLTQGKKSWRDQIDVHPAAEKVPKMSSKDLVELGRDIVEKGLKHHIVLWTPDRFNDFSANQGRNNFLLDGRSRLDAIELVISDPKQREDAIQRALRVAQNPTGSPGEDGGAIQLYGDVEPYAFVISANLHRRHLTPKGKRDVIEQLLKENPERSDRETARAAKVHHETVASVRSELESTGEIRQLEKRLGRDGKARPIRHSTSQRVSKPKLSPAQRRDITISDFARLLHQELTDTLGDLTRLLTDKQALIAKLPSEKRVEFARAYLRALDVSVDDLLRREGA